MQYSFTEKKRIRKNFAKRVNVHQIPFLLSTQLESFSDFLQADIASGKRNPEGLQAAFMSVFPIVSHNGFARLEFVSYSLSSPAFDVKECQQRGLTFCSALRAKVRLVLLDKESPSKPVIKEVKEQEVYMGEMPLMTPTGSFVINGTERLLCRSCIARRVFFSSMIKVRRIAPANCFFLRGLFPTVVHG